MAWVVSQEHIILHTIMHRFDSVVEWILAIVPWEDCTLSIIRFVWILFWIDVLTYICALGIDTSKRDES